MKRKPSRLKACDNCACGKAVRTEHYHCSSPVFPGGRVIYSEIFRVLKKTGCLANPANIGDLIRDVKEYMDTGYDGSVSEAKSLETIIRKWAGGK